jgi:flagellar protein FliO/FliZ
MTLTAVSRFVLSICVATVVPMQVWAEKVSPEASAKTPLLTEPVGVGHYLQTFFGLAVVLLLIVGMAWLMKRLGRYPTTGQSALRILASLPMGQRERVVLLQVGDTQLLVGIAPGHIRTLHQLEQPIATEQLQHVAQGSFAEKLATVLKKQGTLS